MFETIHTVVFEAQEGGGNPAPVTLHDGTLSSEEMQRMAAQWGEEAVFLGPTQRPGCHFQARYFLPLHELGMCLHATIGSAVALVERGKVTDSPIRYETSLGEVRIDWERKDGQVQVGVWQFLPQAKEEIPTLQELCYALNISPEALSPLPAESLSTSRFKMLVPLRDKETLNQLEPNFEALWELCDRYGVTGLYPFAREGERFFARQFPNRAGYNEDPATGVAASALGAYIVRHGLCPIQEGWNGWEVYQGFAMGRPSVIGADVLVENGVITATRVRGSAKLD